MTHRDLFRRLVFALSLIGLAAFALADGSVGLLLIGGSLMALSWFVVESAGGRPLPKWLLNTLAILALAWLTLDVFARSQEMFGTMGRFTVLLQLVLFYGRKTNREYGMILVLSLLQITGAAVMATSIGFALVLAVYVAVGLATALLFHLELMRESVADRQRKLAPPLAEVTPPVPPSGRFHLSQLWLTTLAIGVACAAVAVPVFLFMPRGEKAQIGSFLNHKLDAQAWFPTQVQLGNAPPPTLPVEPVLRVQVRIDGEPVKPGLRSWLLRGAVLDRYDPRQRMWTRGALSAVSDSVFELPPQGLALAPTTPGASVVEATVTLRSGLQRSVFTLYPPTSMHSDLPMTLMYNPTDQQLNFIEPRSGALRYRVTAPLHPSSARRARADRSANLVHDAYYARGWHTDEDRIREFTLATLRAAGADRHVHLPPNESDLDIASVIEASLRTSFAYALEDPDPGDADSVTYFLFEHKRGHCELFASAMAAMARSVGMSARLVTGYRAMEYNAYGDYYVVRPAHAHAWVEVYCGQNGWVTFDPTPPTPQMATMPGAPTQEAAGWLAGIRELYEHVEFAWINTIVRYDRFARQRFVSDFRSSLLSGDGIPGAEAIRNLFDAFHRLQLDEVSLSVLIVITVFVILGLLSLLRTLIQRRRRLTALQLGALPRRQRLELARQLGFYLVMLDLLESHGHSRPTWQSPFAFAQDLITHHPGRLDPVLPLTEIFYEIRFGYRGFDQARQTLVETYLEQLRRALRP